MESPIWYLFPRFYGQEIDKGAGITAVQLSSNTIRQGLFQEKMYRSQVQKIWLVSGMASGMIRLNWK